MLIAGIWGFAEATLFFIVPDVWLTLIAVRRGLVPALAACGWALAGALAGGLAMYAWGVFDSAAARDVRQPSVPALLVLSKSDLGCVWTSADIAAQKCRSVVAVSAALGTEIENLRSEIACTLGVNWADQQLTGLFNARQERAARELLGRRGELAWSRAIRNELLGEDR